MAEEEMKKKKQPTILGTNKEGLEVFREKARKSVYITLGIIFGIPIGIFVIIALFNAFWITFWILWGIALIGYGIYYLFKKERQYQEKKNK